jgi:hypothetical protein
MRNILFSLLIGASFTFVGCAAQTSESEEGLTATTEDALSATAKGFVGAYRSQDRAIYPRFELSADHTYSWDTGIRCTSAPCPSGDAGSWQLYNGRSGAKYVKLTASAGAEERWFRKTNASPFTIAGVFGTEGVFTKATAAPQLHCPTIRCMQGTYCDENEGNARCVPVQTCATTSLLCIDPAQHCVDTAAGPICGSSSPNGTCATTSLLCIDPAQHCVDTAAGPICGSSSPNGTCATTSLRCIDLSKHCVDTAAGPICG